MIFKMEDPWKLKQSQLYIWKVSFWLLKITVNLYEHSSNLDSDTDTAPEENIPSVEILGEKIQMLIQSMKWRFSAPP